MKARLRLAGVLLAGLMPLGAAWAGQDEKPEIPPEQVAELLRQTLIPDPVMRQQFLMILRGRDNPDVVPGLIQVMQFVADDGWLDRTLAGLTGEAPGKSWKEWMLWQQAHPEIAPFEGFGGSEPLEQILTDDRAIHDTMASMIAHGVFTRHPQLKAVSIENGSYFVHRLIKRLKKAANSHPRLFPEDPVEQLRNNVWIAPYYEDDLPELASVIGVEKILFGSDWPHGEGLENPVSFTEELAGFSADDIRKVMRDNALDLLDVKVGSAA